MVRSLYHFNETDQDWINRGKLIGSSGTEKDQLKYYNELISSRVEALKRLHQELSERSIDLVLFAAPYHSSVTRIGQNSYTWNEALSLSDMGDVPFLDYRDLALADEKFADYLHLNINGARAINLKFSEILSEKIGCKND